VTTAADQTYLAIHGAAATQQNANARVLAEHGTNQLGQPHPANPDYRIWDGNLTRIGHHHPRAFLNAVGALLPDHMHVDRAHHRYAHLHNGVWTRCHPDDPGAVPITYAVTQTREL
jgi:hypothetical protein